MSTRSILFIALLPALATAQTTHTVQVGGSTVGGQSPYYDPAQLTVEVGDQVTWQNVSGTHNINGSTNSYPANPEGFSSGSAQSGGWTFSHTFTIAGTYNYHCTQPGHSATQSGTIIVQPGSQTSVEELDGSDVALAPVPARDVLMVHLGGLDIERADVITVEGRQVLSRPVYGDRQVAIPLHGLASGHYFVRLVARDGRALVRPFRKD
ncbi:MAG: plastocyanin/azurin family copper-binding protein [Flavobacteriales bacterium]|jgi:plastocyanin|nr:plastocyanin/azurin family copper-binding protein [Flavobacteriales bacterium]